MDSTTVCSICEMWVALLFYKLTLFLNTCVYLSQAEATTVFANSLHLQREKNPLVEGNLFSALACLDITAQDSE